MEQLCHATYTADPSSEGVLNSSSCDESCVFPATSAMENEPVSQLMLDEAWYDAVDLRVHA